MAPELRFVIFVVLDCTFVNVCALCELCEGVACLSPLLYVQKGNQRTAILRTVLFFMDTEPDSMIAEFSTDGTMMDLKLQVGQEEWYTVPQQHF